jgi:DNA polymerase III alpha subunit (gram-positive type)
MVVPSGLLTLNGNLLCAIDSETTGLMSGYNELTQISIIPLNNEFEISEQYPFFSFYILPKHFDRYEIEAQKKTKITQEFLELNALDKYRVADLLDDWFTNLELPEGKRIAPLAFNWPFDKAFIEHWLGLETFNQFFLGQYRDPMVITTLLNDLAAWHGRLCPFASVSLSKVCTKLGIEYTNKHNSLDDAIATAKVYKKLILALGAKY